MRFDNDDFEDEFDVYENSERYVECPDCEGTGWYCEDFDDEYPSQTECVRCEGEGYIHIDDL